MEFMFGVSLTLAALLCSVQCLSGPLTVSLSMGREFQLGEDIDCKVTITNNRHDKDLHLLKRNTPLDGLTAPIFAVTHNGKPLAYEGPLFKWLTPTDEDYALIPAGSSLSSSVDLSEVYGFRAAGTYSVKMSASLNFFENSATNSTSKLVTSNSIMIFVGASKSNAPPKLTLAEIARRDGHLNLTQGGGVGSPKSPYFDGSGSNADKSASVTAYNAAYKILSTCANAVNTNTKLYTTWFGTRYTGYVDTVKGAYLNIKSAMESKSFTLYFYGPECRRGVVAYTYHGDTTLYLCDGYVSAPTTGSDSKMGTIVHEMSHAVAYTEDYEYGEVDCQALAKSSPSKAINNADNYEYFAEHLY